MISINNSFKRHIARSLIHPPFSIYILPLANWVCLINLGSTLLVFRVARWILSDLGPPAPPRTLQDPPGSTLVTIPQVFVLSSPPGLYSGLTGSVWVAWLPHFLVSVLHGGFYPIWAPQDPPGPPRLNLGYNSPGVCPSLSPWAPFWANW